MKTSQLYSVFDYQTGSYDYYEAPLVDLPASGTFRAPRMVGGVVVPESLAVKVPPGARHVGKGENPRGLISSHLAGVEPLPSLPRWAWGLALVGAAVWWSRR